VVTNQDTVLGCTTTRTFTITVTDACNDTATAYVTNTWTTATLAISGKPRGGSLGCNPTNLPTVASVSNAVTLADSCSEATYVVTSEDTNSGCTTTRTFTINASDACGDTATATVKYTWTTATLTITGLPSSGYLGCNPTNLPTDASVRAGVTTSDTCSTAKVVVTNQDSVLACTTTRTFTITVTDACNDTATAYVTNTWTTATLVISGKPRGGYLGCNPTNLPTVTGVSNAVALSDSCSASSYSVIETNLNFGCSNSLIFTISASDACGDQASTVVTYTYTTATLLITNAPAGGYLGCNPTNLPTVTSVSNAVALSDSCSASSYRVIETNFHFGCSNSLIFTISASDACGDHASTVVTYTYTTATLLITNAPAGGYLGCNPTNLPTVTGVSNAVALSDSCSASSYSVIETNFNFGCSNSLIFTITASDACGDHASTVVTYTYTTATLSIYPILAAPSGFVPIGETVALGCNPTNLPTDTGISNSVALADSCSTATYIVTQTNLNFGCSNVLIFTIDASDTCGNETSTNVTYTWTTSTLQFTNVPAGAYLGCNPTNLPTVASVSNAVSVSGDGGLVTINVTQTQSTAPVFPQEYTITDLGTLPGGDFSEAYAVNDSGQVVGQSATSSGYHAFSYSAGTMTDLGALTGGGVSEAYGVNNSGEVVGAASVSGGLTHAFLYTAGAMVDLNSLIPPGSGWVLVWAQGINDNGQIVGQGFTPSGETHAFLYSAGTMTDLGALTGTGVSKAFAVNDGGEVVGYSGISSGAFHAFSYSAGTMTDLGTLGTLPSGTYSYANAVNNSGEVVGYSGASSGAFHAFSYSPGTMTDLGTLTGGSGSQANGVNDSGEMVGMSTDISDSERAFIDNGSAMVDLNTRIPTGSGWVLEWATGINDNGQIVGYGFDPSGRTVAFLLTPTVPCVVTQIFTILATVTCGTCTNTATACVTNTWTTNPPPAILTPASVCADSTNTAVGPPGEAGYAWTITGGAITTGAGTQTVTYTADASGEVVLTLTITNGCGCSATATDRVLINPVPATPTISPTPASVAPNSTGNTAIGPAGESSWTWTITGGAITSGAGTQTVTYTAGASGDVVLTLTVANASGCTAQNSATIPITP
jgi:probable HAF family extracellular repeat protein